MRKKHYGKALFLREKDTFPEISGATNLRGHYAPIVVGGIKHMDRWVELYRMAKKAI